MARPKVIIQIYPMLPADGMEGRIAAAPLGRDRDLYHQVLHDWTDLIWTKYTGAEPPYGLRDPSIDERRVLFECRVDKVSTFGQP